MKISRFVGWALSVLLVAGSAASALAEDPSPKGLGLHLGLNLADVSTNSNVDTNSTTGYAFGATYDYPIAPDFSILPGAQFIQRGFGFDVGISRVDLKITYLEIPVMFQARFTGASIVPFFIGGPVLGFKLSTGCSVSGGDCTVYDDHQVKAMHMGLELGGGTLFPLSNDAQIMAQLRYHLGLTRVAGGLSDPRHRGLLFEVGYLF